MQVVILFLVLLSTSVFSQEVSVSKVKGQEATIIIPKGHKIEVGDSVFLTKEKEVIFKKDSSADEKMKQVDFKTKREHDLWFDISFNSRRNEYGKSKDASLKVGYGYNFGYIEPFINYVASAYNDGTSAYSYSGIGGGFEVNFIKNEPGNILIPFLSLGVDYNKGEEKYSTIWGPRTYDVNAGGVTLGLGLKWFILKENFAVRLGYYVSNHNFNYEYEGEIVETGNLNTTMLMSGFSFYF